jgi:hypothetical protein
MFRTTRSLFAAAVAGFACVGTAHAVTFFDGVFNNPDWSLTTMTDAGGVGSTTQGLQFVAGGNPTAYRRIRDQLVVSGGSGGALYGLHMNNTAFYTPSASGAITSISYSEDSINFIPGTIVPGNGQGSGLVIFQNSSYYILRNPILVMPYAGYSSWTANSAPSIAAADMWELTGTGTLVPTSNPDFSAAGTVMQFGFTRGNSGNGGYNTDCGIDNWNVQIVPSPGSFALLGLAGLAGIRRRRR